MSSDNSQNPATNTVYVFIDASNLWEALKAKGKFLNFDTTIKHIKEKSWEKSFYILFKKQCVAGIADWRRWLYRHFGY